ncbi:MAG: hypothetical protein ACUVUE_07830 [Candidatus Bathycorpusculaceae bacterium]
MGSFIKFAKTSKSLPEKHFEVKPCDVYRIIVGEPAFVKEAVHQDLKPFCNMWQKIADYSAS